MEKIPHTLFSTDHVPIKDRYDAWRESMGVIFEIEKEDTLESSTFEAHVEAFMYDELVVGMSQSTAAHYTRTSKKLNGDGLDMIMIQLFLEGEMQFGLGQDTTHIQKGDMVVFDLGQKAQNFDADNRLLALIFPREVITEYVPEIDRWHGQILPRDQPVTKLLRDHFLSLFRYGSEVTTDVAASIQRSTMELTASAFRPSKDHLARSKDIVTSTILQEIKRHIWKHLADADLSPESIAATFGLSRAQLYRITEPLDGIMNHIRMLRLRRCMSELRNPLHSNSSISAIGYKWGFNDIRTFNRNFKQTFGITPKDARELGKHSTSQHSLVGNLDHLQVDRSYEAWLRSQA